MATYEEYRKYASECLDSAKNAKSEDERQAYLDLAEHWLRAAIQVRPEVTGDPSEPLKSA